MRRRRCDRILMGMIAAFVLAAPAGTKAQEPAPEAKFAAVPVEAPAPQGAPSASREDPLPTSTSAPSDSQPSVSLDPADQAIAAAIRDLLASGADQIFSGGEERQKVQAFYQTRAFAPLWLDNGVENARKTAVATRLAHADADGLEPRDYAVPSFAGNGSDTLAQAELKFTQVVITFARHLQAGRFSRHQLNYEIGLPQALPDPEQVLSKLAQAADAGAALDEFSPPHEPYRRLKAMLATLRAKADPTSEAQGETRALHSRRTHEASDHDKIETIIANMERWRWYPRDLGEAHIIANLPDFSLRVVRGGSEIWNSRIVIGEQKRPTPLLSEKMSSITLNPVWHVPPSIVRNEYLPALARDHNVLARMGLHLSYKDGEAQITMPAGGNNPLGHIRFNFYNRFMVFQHDTPDQYMFGHAVRAESHGCMRVEHAAKYAEVLFNMARPGERWTAEKVKSTFGGAEQEIPIDSTPIWLHLTYQTAFVDDEGRLQIRRDLYNLDRRTLAAIKGGAAAAPAVAIKHEPEAVPARRHRHRTARSSSRETSPSPFGPAYATPRAGGRIIYR